MTSSRDTIFLTHDLAEAASHKGATVVVLDLDDPRFADRRVLPPTKEDLSRSDSYGAAARKMFLARRALFRHFLATRLGCDAEEIVIAADPSGAPTLIAPKQNQPFFLSISRRGSFAAFAAATTPVGVDIEILSQPEDVPSAMLHESERKRLSGTDAVAGNKAFLELWTLKEAYLKALWLGLSREPSEIAVTFTDGGLALFDRGAPVPAKALLSKAEPLGKDTLIIGCVLL
jgi:4'-phosphopantetheinyl transferase